MGDSGLIFLSVTYLVVIRGVVADLNPLASPSPSQRDGETMVPVKLLKNMKVPVSSHRSSALCYCRNMVDSMKEHLQRQKSF